MTTITSGQIVEYNLYRFYNEDYDELIAQRIVHERFFQIGVELKENGKTKRLFNKIVKQIVHYKTNKDENWLMNNPIILDDYCGRVVIVAMQKALKQHNPHFGNSLLVFCIGKTYYPNHLKKCSLIILRPPLHINYLKPGNMVLSIFSGASNETELRLPYGEFLYRRLLYTVIGNLDNKFEETQRSKKLAELLIKYTKKIKTFKIHDFNDDEYPKLATYKKSSVLSLDATERIYSRISFLNSFNLLINIFEVVRLLHRWEDSFELPSKLDELALGIYQARVLTLVAKGEVSFQEIYDDVKDTDYEPYKEFLDQYTKDDNPTDLNYRLLFNNKVMHKRNYGESDTVDNPRGVYGIVAGKNLSNHLDLVKWKRRKLNDRYNSRTYKKEKYNIPGRNHNKYELLNLYGEESVSSDNDYSDDSYYDENCNRFIQSTLDTIREGSYVEKPSHRLTYYNILSDKIKKEEDFKLKKDLQVYHKRKRKDVIQINEDNIQRQSNEKKRRTE